tara:strand:+ start:347 stop:688 length:342 start_codon:yes stop_codon:yes gene_type:complete
MKMNKKAELTMTTIAVAILVIFVVGGLLLWFSGAFGTAKASFDVIGTSDESVWRQSCINACNVAQLQTTECATDWENLYCRKSYNSTVTCEEAEDQDIISKCKLELEGQTCRC